MAFCASYKQETDMLSQVTPVIEQTMEPREAGEKDSEGPLETLGLLSIDSAAFSLADAVKEIRETATSTHSFSSQINCIQCTRTGVAVGLKNGRLAFIRPGRGVIELKGNNHRNVSCLAARMDGSLIVTGGEKAVKVWSVEKQQELTTFEGHTSWVHCMSLTADGNFAVSGANDHTARVWSLGELAPVATLLGHTGEVSCIVSTPDSLCVATGSCDSHIKLWSVSDWTESVTFAGHASQVECLAVSPDSITLVSGSQDCTVRLWNIKTKAPLAVLSGHGKAIRSVAVARDNLFLASGSFDKTVKLWHMAERREVATLPAFEKMLQTVTFTPNCQFLVAGGDSCVKLWEKKTFLDVAVLEGHSKFVQCVSISPDGTLLASGAMDNTVRLWPIRTRRRTNYTHGHTSIVIAVTATPDGQFLVTAAEKLVKLWSFAEDSIVRKYEGHTKLVQCVAVTSDSAKIVSGAKDKTLCMWDLASGELLARLSGHGNVLNCVAVALDGGVAVSGSADFTVKVWSLRERREIATLSGHTDNVRAVQVTPDSEAVISGSVDHTMKIWSLKDFQLLASVDTKVRCLAITPDGSRIITGSSEKHVLVWDFARRSVVAHLAGHEDAVWSLAVSRDGLYLASGAMDCKVKVWTLVEMRHVAEFAAHSMGVTNVAITADSESVVSTSWDKAVLQHDISFVSPKQRASPACSLFAANLSRLTFGMPVHLFIASYCVPRYRMNSLHVSAYYNRAAACARDMSAGVALLRGVFGSPLTVALDRNAGKSIDSILEVINSRPMDDADWADFDAIAEDLPRLIGRNSQFTVPLCSRLFCKTSQPGLPNFISPLRKLPMILSVPCRNISLLDFARFSGGDLEKTNSCQVDFSLCVFKWNFSNGSSSSLQLLSALHDSPYFKDLLSTPFFSVLIRKKWDELFAWVLGLTALYTLLLVVLITLVFSHWRTDVLASFFIVLNVLLLLYEIPQMVSARCSYFVEVWNSIDLVRSLLSISWAGLLLRDHNPQYLRLAVVVFCFLRGFTYFRTFRPTRVFVNMTLRVARDIIAFLLILAYSVFAFGVMASVMNEDESATDAWTVAFSLLMGGFDNSLFGLVQWVIFVAANIVNVIVMLNLLISIIGDAYERAQMSLAETDNNEMFEVVFELESILLWRRASGSPGILSMCRAVQGIASEDEWAGRINAISSIIREGHQTTAGKVAEGVAEVKQAVGLIVDRKVDALAARVTDMERQLGEINRKLDRLVGGSNTNKATQPS